MTKLDGLGAMAIGAVLGTALELFMTEGEEDTAKYTSVLAVGLLLCAAEHCLGTTAAR
jgi:hypothetical protein